MRALRRWQPKLWLALALLAVALALATTAWLMAAYGLPHENREVMRVWPWDVRAWELCALAALGSVFLGLAMAHRGVRVAVLWVWGILCFGVVFLASVRLMGCYPLLAMVIGFAWLRAIRRTWPQAAFRGPRLRREALEPPARVGRDGA